MRKKYILIPLVVIVVGFIGAVIYMLSTFSLFDDNSQLIEEIEMPQGYIVKIYHIPSDATIQDAIVVMKSKHGQETLISKFERYDMLKNYRLISSDSLELILVDKNLKSSNEHTTIIGLPNE